MIKPLFLNKNYNNEFIYTQIYVSILSILYMYIIHFILK